MLVVRRESASGEGVSLLHVTYMAHIPISILTDHPLLSRPRAVNGRLWYR